MDFVASVAVFDVVVLVVAVFVVVVLEDVGRSVPGALVEVDVVGFLNAVISV